MLILASATDKVRITTTGTADLDVHASWIERGGLASLGRSNTSINTATTTDIVDSPPGSASRVVKTMCIRNRHVSSPQTITVIHTDGTTAIEVYKCTLLAGESAMYSEIANFWQCDAQGRIKHITVTNAGAPITSGEGIVVLSGDVINNNAVANTIQDVTGLAFPVTATKLYWFEFHIVFTAAATSTGSRWSISGPVSPTYLNYESRYSLTSTTETRNPLLQAYDLPAASNATSATTGNNWARIEGLIRPSADGNVIARFASEILSSAITAKIGSFVRYIQLT